MPLALITKSERERLVQFIREHREAVATDAECVYAAIDHFQLPVKKVKSAVYRYIKLAFPHRHNNVTPNADVASSELFRQGEGLIREALKNIDHERNILTNRIKELDNMAAKYRNIL